jgi:acetyltransferase-like isoleucine patch superfamily enzyme
MKGKISFLYGWRTRIGNYCDIDDFVEFKCPTLQAHEAKYNILLDEHVFIGRGTIIDSNLSVKIGRDTFIAPYCFITDTHHKFIDSGTLIRMQGCDYKAVVIGEDVWIGAHVVVIAGVSIGRGSIIGANSTVTHDIPPNVFACGSPARVTRIRDHG